MVLLHLLHEDAPHVLNRVQVWRHTRPFHHLHLQQQGSCNLGGVLVVVVKLENSFWRKGIIFCFRMSQYMLESMFPSINHGSLVPAVVMQPQTMMLPPPCLTVGKAQFSWYSSPGRRHTCWTPSEVKQVYLRLIRSQDMVPVIHALGQVVFSKLQAFLVSRLQKRHAFWEDSHANRLVAVCGVWSEHRQADLPLLQPLKQCWQHSCVCWSQLLHLMYSTRTQLLWSTLARPVLSLGKPLYDPGHCSVTQFQAVTELLIA